MFPPTPTHLQVLLNGIFDTNGKLLVWSEDYNQINKALLGASFCISLLNCQYKLSVSKFQGEMQVGQARFTYGTQEKKGCCIISRSCGL